MVTIEALESLEDLSRAESEQVIRFIAYLKALRKSPDTEFMRGVERFMERHPELLRRLAQ